MVTHPSLCPIPPGFVVVGDFNDDFRHFKNGTGYDNFKGDGIHNYGVSKRWRNPNIRSAGMVCGFQFKIGPTIGSRFKLTLDSNDRPVTELLGEVDSGDINLHFPRRERTGGDRGGYIVQLKWYRDNSQPDGMIAEAKLDKEIPHSTYGGVNRFREHDFLPGHPNPRSIEKTQIRDGQWHSLVGFIYNDWHHSSGGASGEFPIIGLWYSDKATSDFREFKLMGMGADIGNMDPRGPLMEEIGHDEHPIIDIDDLLDFPDDIHELGGLLNDVFLPGVGSVINFFGGDVVGDDLTVAEHALQIRIDDVPLNEIEIRNVYAASVNYIGISLPQGTGLCSAEAKAIIDAQASLQSKLEQEKEARRHLITPGEGIADESNPWRQILDNLANVEIPNARSDLRAAEFLYVECSNRPPTDVTGPGGTTVLTPDCTPLKDKLDDIQSTINGIKDQIKDLQNALHGNDDSGDAGSKSDILKEIQALKTQLTRLEPQLENAKKAYEDCKNQGPLVSDGGTIF